MKGSWFLRQFTGLLVIVACVSCASLSGNRNKKKEPPEITHEMPLSDAIEAGMEHGEVTLNKVIRLIKIRKQWAVAGDILFDSIKNNYQSWPSVRLINAAQLYELSAHSKSDELFYLLSFSERHLIQQLAWHLAGSRPSKQMAVKIEERLTVAIDTNELKEIYWPGMADAVAANMLKSSYTVVRQGLFENNHIAFAKAMIALNPSGATDDFLDYLSLASLEELRQLSLNSVDVFTCVEILKHLKNFPPSVSHRKFTHLFYYAISRNTALAEMARSILEDFFPGQNSMLAQMLSRLPNWVQIAFVEGSRRQMTPKLSLFLKELKGTTSQKEVVEEIDHVVR